jgi:hypothetical protein
MAQLALKSDAPLVTAVFRTAAQVESAYEAAVERGYTIGDVNVVMSDDTRRRLYAQNPESSSEIGKKAAEGAELSGPTGGGVGIAISIAAAVGAAIALPGLDRRRGPDRGRPRGRRCRWPRRRPDQRDGGLGPAGRPPAALRVGTERRGILMGVRTRNAEDAGTIARRWTELGAEHLHA